MSVTDIAWATLMGFVCWLVSMALLLYAKIMFSKSVVKHPRDIVAFRLGVVGLYGGILIFWRVFYTAPPSVLPEAEWFRYGAYGALIIIGLLFSWFAKQAWDTSYKNAKRNSIARRAAAPN